MSERGVTSGSRTEEDMISFLPDHLLCQILSHVPTKTGVMTSVLSTRWRIVWLSTPLLDLHTDDFPSFTPLASFISRFLDGSSCLHKLKLAFGSGRPTQDISNEFLRLSFDFEKIIPDISNDPAYLMTQWLNNAVTRKVQHVDILYPIEDNLYPIEDNLYPVRMMRMPLSIYTCETLVSLKLFNVSLAVSEYFSLPRLKIMHLVRNVYTNDAFLEKLISSCSVLEELTVVRNREYDLRVLQVCSKSIKSLVVDLDGIKSYSKDCRVVVIDAPGLNNFRLKDDEFTSYVISNLSSSAKVDIDVSFNVNRSGVKRFFIMLSCVRDMTRRSSNRSVMRSFFTMLSSVRDMTISETTLEGICIYLKHEPVPQFPYLVRLHAVLYNSDLEHLPNILQICPNLKSLVLELRNLKEEELLVFSSSSSVPVCLRSSLEYVEIKTPIRGAVAEIELVKYFLENSAVLKKFTCLRLRRMNEESNISMELLRLWRCSPSCDVVVQLEELSGD